MKRIFEEGDIVRIISLPPNFDNERNRLCIGKVGPVDEEPGADSPLYLIDNNKYCVNFLAENLEIVSYNLEKVLAKMDAKIQDYENKLKTK